MNFRTIFVILLSLLATSAEADDGQVGELSRISLGGKLYDNHWLQVERRPPDEPYPGYPGTMDLVAGDTWRCVSCHGWDYSGSDGHLGRQASSELFVSLRSSAGRSPVEIAQLLTSGRHRKVTRVLQTAHIEALSAFISAGLHPIEDALDDGRATGSANRGKDIYEGACVSCHQADGKAYIQGEPGDKPALGWVANNRPAQALHKIRNGIPSTDMLSLRFLPQPRVIDLLTYLQTLDTEPLPE